VRQGRGITGVSKSRLIKQIRDIYGNYFLTFDVVGVNSVQ